MAALHSFQFSTIQTFVTFLFSIRFWSNLWQIAWFNRGWLFRFICFQCCWLFINHDSFEYFISHAIIKCYSPKKFTSNISREQISSIIFLILYTWDFHVVCVISKGPYHSNVVCATSKESDQPVKLLTEYNLELLTINQGYTGSSVSFISKYHIVGNLMLQGI